MATNLEIERKFLVIGESWKAGAKAVPISQGYLYKGKDMVLRARTKGDKGILTIKADKGGISRLEFEYEIPVDDVKAMFSELCADPPLEKTRHIVKVGGMTWEIDEFHGVNQGLVMAEIELENADQSFDMPEWAGPEVSDDNRFFNAYLSEKPFSTWGITQAELIAEKG
ncbi:MAG: CYTH domain-containing protein [Rhodospirillales bacterium]|nr:CYTH domain-containing protein [Rhodospirillales bacterium]